VHNTHFPAPSISHFSSTLNQKELGFQISCFWDIRKDVNCRLKLLPKTGHFGPRFTSLSTKFSCISSNPMSLLCTITYPRHHFQRPKQIPAPITIYYAPAPFCSPSPSPIPSFPCMLLLITLNHCQQYDYFKTILFGAGVVVIESPSCRLHLWTNFEEGLHWTEFDKT